MIKINIFKCCIKHKYLFFANMLSLVLAFFLPVQTFIWEHKFVYSDIFSIPFVFAISTFLVSLISIVFFEKRSLFVRIFSSIANVLIIILELFYVLVFYLLSSMIYADRTFSEPEEYVQALNSVRCQECVAHFPKNIPTTATNVELYKSQSSWFGSTDILLKFNIDEVYINNELKKYNFTKVETPEHYTFSYNSIVPLNGKKINTDHFTYYVIMDDTVGSNPNAHNYSLGIGINKELGQIIYYYSNPD